MADDSGKHEAEDMGCAAGQGAACPSTTRGEEQSLDAWLERKALQERMGLIRHKIIVLSGKGGVGKSTVAANLAISLALAGRKVGLLDVDIHGPSIPKMLRLDDARAQVRDGAIEPVTKAGLKIMSIGFLLRNSDDAVIWRGPMKMNVIRQFLQDVDWGELDYLVIDSPPGTGDEPLSVCQLVENADGAIVVTTPQAVSTADVRRSIGFCRQMNLPVLGVVENMSTHVCSKCGHEEPIFGTGGGERMAAQYGVRLLGSVPLDIRIRAETDDGRPSVVVDPDGPLGRAYLEMARCTAAQLSLAAAAGSAFPKITVEET